MLTTAFVEMVRLSYLVHLRETGYAALMTRENIRRMERECARGRVLGIESALFHRRDVAPPSGRVVCYVTLRGRRQTVIRVISYPADVCGYDGSDS